MKEVGRVEESYLLRRNVVGRSSHVNFLVGVQTRNDEEDSRASSFPCQQPAQPEDDGPLVLLDHLHHEEEGEGEGGGEEDDGADGEDVREYLRSLLTA